MAKKKVAAAAMEKCFGNKEEDDDEDEGEENEVEEVQDLSYLTEYLGGLPPRKHIRTHEEIKDLRRRNNCPVPSDDEDDESEDYEEWVQKIKLRWLKESVE
jgi:hypothetical protein